MTLDEFVGKGWNDHGNDAEGVWTRLPEGLALIESPPQMFALANLATHVSGEHLGRWDDGIAFLERMTALPLWNADSDEAKGVRRLQSGLEYCAGRRDESEAKLKLAMPASPPHVDSPRVRMLAVAASAFASQRRVSEAAATFEEALRFAAYGPKADDPAARALAVTGNGLSVEFELRPTLDDEERRMMLRAAETARRYWEIAGDWMTVERAEYRLALAHVKAGLPEKALEHAKECLRIVTENSGNAYEQFFAHEALAQVKHALGDGAGAKTERDAAAEALPKIAKEGSRDYCAGELTKLDAMLG